MLRSAVVGAQPTRAAAGSQFRCTSVSISVSRVPGLGLGLRKQRRPVGRALASEDSSPRPQTEVLRGWLTACVSLSQEEAQQVLFELPGLEQEQCLANLSALGELFAKDPAGLRNLLLQHPKLLAAPLVGWMGVCSVLGSTSALTKLFFSKHAQLLCDHDPAKALANVALLRTLGLEILRSYPQILTLDLELQVLPALDFIRGLFHDYSSALNQGARLQDITYPSSFDEPGPAAPQGASNSLPQGTAASSSGGPVPRAASPGLTELHPAVHMLEVSWGLSPASSSVDSVAPATPPPSPAASFDSVSGSSDSLLQGAPAAASGNTPSQGSAAAAAGWASEGRVFGPPPARPWRPETLLQQSPTGPSGALAAAQQAAQAAREQSEIALMRQRLQKQALAAAKAASVSKPPRGGRSKKGGTSGGDAPLTAGDGEGAAAGGNGGAGAGGAPTLLPTAEMAFRTMVQNFPEFVLYLVDPDTNSDLNAKVAYLRSEGGLSQLDVGTVMLACPSFFQADLERNMKPKVALLQRMGFQGTRLRTLLVGCPAVLAVSRKQLERRWRFLQMVVGSTPEDVVECPQVLACSVYEALGPAYFYIRASCQRELEKDNPNISGGSSSNPAGGPSSDPRSPTPPAAQGTGSTASSKSKASKDSGKAAGGQPMVVTNSGLSNSKAWRALCNAEGRLRLSLLLAVSTGGDLVREGPKGERLLEHLPSFYDVNVYLRAAKEWRKGPGQGWKE